MWSQGHSVVQNNARACTHTQTTKHRTHTLPTGGAIHALPTVQDRCAREGLRRTPHTNTHYIRMVPGSYTLCLMALWGRMMPPLMHSSSAISTLSPRTLEESTWAHRPTVDLQPTWNTQQQQQANKPTSQQTNTPSQQTNRSGNKSRQRKPATHRVPLQSESAASCLGTTIPTTTTQKLKQHARWPDTRTVRCIPLHMQHPAARWAGRELLRAVPQKARKQKKVAAHPQWSS